MKPSDCWFTCGAFIRRLDSPKQKCHTGLEIPTSNFDILEYYVKSWHLTFKLSDFASGSCYRLSPAALFPANKYVFLSLRGSNSRAFKIAGLTTLACLLLASQVFTAYTLFGQKQQIHTLQKNSDRMSRQLTRTPPGKKEGLRWSLSRNVS